MSATSACTQRSLRRRVKRPDYLNQIEMPTMEALLAEGWEVEAVEEDAMLEAREKEQACASTLLPMHHPVSCIPMYAEWPVSSPSPLRHSMCIRYDV